MKVIFYYDNGDGTLMTYDYDSKTIDIRDKFELYHEKNEKTKTRNYEIFKGYNMDEEGLKQYANDFMNWCDELKNNDIFIIDYIKDYTGHNMAVKGMFKKLCHGKYEHLEDIDPIEYQWIEKCNNSGLFYCKTGIFDSHGYDFKNFYSSILASEGLEIPSQKGKEYVITEIDYKKL